MQPHLRALPVLVALIALASCAVNDTSILSSSRIAAYPEPATAGASQVVKSNQNGDAAATRPFAPNNDLGFGTDGKSLASDAPRQVRVFFATNRHLVPHPTGEGQTFGAGRNPKLTYGFADVSIPKEHRLGNIERPVIWRLELSDNDKKHVVVKAVHQAEPAYFWSIFSDHAKSSPGTVLFFVHGFANSFDDAARRAAQMKYDLAFEGPVFFFS